MLIDSHVNLHAPQFDDAHAFEGPRGRRVTLVGHPFTPIGMGEHVRCTFRALRSVARTPRLHDIYRLTEADVERE